ncbi:MAG TPA: FAD-dependent monooxygenase [Steroidobacteraceae bacterium]|nr:FAD-dependent monooxygenase [Steroidobacteraceae bacterium]
MSRAEETLDVLVVGAGPTGACAAALLKREAPQLSVAILEHARPEAPPRGAPLDVRVSALSRASERILTRAAAWGRIAPERVQPYERMRVWNEMAGARANVLVFDAAEAGEPNLGHIVENRLVQCALIEAFESSGGRLIEGDLLGLRVQEEHVEAQTATSQLSARLVIGADGARSAVRSAIGLTAEVSSYGQIAIVANVATERPHERTAWQRFLGRGTLALLPLADGSSSIVWSADEEVASALLDAPPENFARELARQSEEVLGAAQLLTDRLSFPLSRMAAHRYTAHRAALIGDAAHVVHPLAGQGVNLGLLDAAALAQVLACACAEREDPGAERILRRYERWRKSETQLMALAIDAFDRFLAHGSGPLSLLAQRGLAWVDRSAEVKRAFIMRALGVSGELPEAARRAAPPGIS